MMKLSTVTCSELLQQIAEGDRRAFRDLYGQVGPKLFAVCLRMMKTRAEAEDVLQDAFVKIWERSWQFDPAKGDGLAWAATVTRHTALDRLRSRTRTYVSIDEDVTAEIDAAVSTEVSDHIGEFGALDRCLGVLREDFRKAVVMSYVNGLTHEELARSMGKPLGTVKSWVNRGLAELRECMDA